MARVIDRAPDFGARVTIVGAMFACAVLPRGQRHCLDRRRLPGARGRDLDRHLINPDRGLVAAGRIRKRVRARLSCPRRCGFGRSFTDPIAIDADVFRFPAVEVTQRDKRGLALAIRNHDGHPAVDQSTEACKENKQSSPDNGSGGSKTRGVANHRHEFFFREAGAFRASVLSTDDRLVPAGTSPRQGTGRLHLSPIKTLRRL